MLSDGGGIVTAVAQPLSGAAVIAKALIGFAKVWRPQDYQLRLTRMNGLPAAVLYDAQGLVFQTTTLRAQADGRINAIYVMRNPMKLTHVA
jgi:RNA polymerase sigma-70 factor (ECF subfamily)